MPSVSSSTVDPISNKLYAIAGNTLEIIDGRPDPEVIAAKVPLDYSPGGLAVNHALRHLYLSNSAKSCIEVRDPPPALSLPRFHSRRARTLEASASIQFVAGCTYWLPEAKRISFM